MTKLDIEDLLERLRAFLVANLNTQISELNSEKSDQIVLKTVADTAYHLQYPQDRAELNDPFVIYDEAMEPVIKSQGGLTATVHHIGITLILADNGMDLDIVKRLFRYRRVLLDLIQANWDRILMGHKFSVKAWSPSPPFKSMETDYTGRMVGIIASVEIAD